MTTREDCEAYIKPLIEQLLKTSTGWREIPLDILFEINALADRLIREAKNANIVEEGGVEK